MLHRREQDDGGGSAAGSPVSERPVRIGSFGARIDGELAVPPGASVLIVLVEGNGGSRRSATQRAIAAALRRVGSATLLLDLLIDEEVERDRYTREYRYDVDLLTQRLVGAIDWLRDEAETRNLRVGLLGAGTAAAAALRAAAVQPEDVGAVVSLRGRPEFTVGVFGLVRAPTLLIVGDDDQSAADLHRAAIELMVVPRKLVTLKQGAHRDDPEEVARLAGGWFAHHLDGGGAAE